MRRLQSDSSFWVTAWFKGSELIRCLPACMSIKGRETRRLIYSISKYQKRPLSFSFLLELNDNIARIHWIGWMIVIVIVIVVWVISICTWCGVFPNVDCRWLYTIHGLYREKFFHRTEQMVSMNDRMYLKRDSCIIIYRSFFFSFHSLLLSPPFSTLSSSRIHLTTTLSFSLSTQQ